MIKIWIITSVDEAMERKEPSHADRGIVNGAVTVENGLAVPRKVTHTITL